MRSFFCDKCNLEFDLDGDFDENEDRVFCPHCTTNLARILPETPERILMRESRLRSERTQNAVRRWKLIFWTAAALAVTNFLILIGGHLFWLMMDWETRNALGVAPLKEMTDAVEDLSSLEALTAYLTETPIEKQLECFWKSKSTSNLEDSEHYILGIIPGNLLLEDSGEYTKMTAAGGLSVMPDTILHLRSAAVSLTKDRR